MNEQSLTEKKGFPSEIYLTLLRSLDILLQISDKLLCFSHLCKSVMHRLTVTPSTLSMNILKDISKKKGYNTEITR